MMQTALSAGEAHQDWLKFSRSQAMRGPESRSSGSGQGLERVGKLLEGFKQENDRAGFALERLNWCVNSGAKQKEIRGEESIWEAGTMGLESSGGIGAAERSGWLEGRLRCG